MEDLERYLAALHKSALIAGQLEKKIEEDKQNIGSGLSGEPERTYKQQCDKAIEQARKIRKMIMVLYSESSAG